MKRTLLIVLSAGLVPVLPAAGQQIFTTYNGPGNGLWGFPGNWSNGLPNNGGGLHYVPLIPGGTAVVHNIPTVIDKIGVGPGSQVTINNGTTLTVLADTTGTGVTGLMSNEGVIHMGGTGALTNIVISGPAGSSVVTGNIFQTPALLSMSNNLNNRIYGATGVEEFVTDVSAEVAGSGQIGINLLRIRNHGVIRANGSAGLVIDPNGAGLLNTGSLVADGGTLNLQSGRFEQSGAGEVVAVGPSVVLLEAGTLAGGVFGSTGTGRLDTISGSIVEDLTAVGWLRVPNGHSLHLRGTLALEEIPGATGTLTLESSGALTNLIVIEGDGTITGAGDVVMGNHLNNRIYSDNGARRLVVEGPGAIRGSGQIGVNLMSLTIGPGSVVQAEGAAGLVINPNGDGVDNEGLMRAAAGSELVLEGGVFDNVGSAIEVDPGGLCTVSGSMIAGGLLTGPASGGFVVQSGSELASITNAGSVALPNGQGIFISGPLNNTGSVNLGSTGALTNLLIRGGDVSLTGGGDVVFSESVSNRIYAEGGVARLTNVDNTIRGSGQIGVNLMAVTNNALIEAVGPGGMIIDPNGGGLDNNGTIRAGADTTLTLQGGVFDNADGEIEVVETGLCVISGSLVSGGDLVGPLTGGFRVQSGSELASVTNAGSILLPSGQGVFVTGTLDNAGNVNLASTGALTNLLIRGGDVSLVGGGDIAFSANVNNRIYAEGGAARLTNVDNTIRGSGQIGVNLMALTNNALIEAVGAGGIIIDPNGAGAENNGTIRATDGSSLTLSSGVFDNADGVIEVAAGGSGLIQSAKVVGGVITTAPGTAFTLLASSELAGVTNSGVANLPNNTSGFLSGTLQNAGTLNVGSTGALTNLNVLGDVTVGGPGALVMSSNINNRIYAPNGVDRLTNGTGHTIRGAGQIGVNLMALTNKGSIIADQAAGMIIDPNGNGFDNQGTLHAQAGDIAISAGPFTTSGAVLANTNRRIDRTAGDWVQTAGSVIANGEVEVDNNVYLLQGGTLGGGGIVDSNVTNSGGVVAPGNSPGALIIEGTYTQQAGGALSVELGGTAPGTGHDQLTVTGAVSLAGTLNIGTTGGFIPGWDQEFTILTGSAVTGVFGTVNAPTLGAGSLKVVYGATSVKVRVCMADCNASGTLSVADFGCFQTRFVTADPYADCNGDTLLTVADFGCFQTKFVAGCP